jgi:hypothetical protein
MQKMQSAHYIDKKWTTNHFSSMLTQLKFLGIKWISSQTVSKLYFPTAKPSFNIQKWHMV